MRIPIILILVFSALCPAQEPARQHTPTFAELLAQPAGAHDHDAIADALLDAQTVNQRREIADVLVSSAPGPALHALLESVTRLPRVPEWLTDALIERAGTADASLAPHALAALVSTHDRRGAIAVMDLAARLPSVRLQAADALSGLAFEPELADLERAEAGWPDWREQISSISEAGWTEMIAQNAARHADTLARRLARQSDRVRQLLRERYLGLGQPERNAMIIELLEDELTVSREVGLQIATQELANARVLPPEVARAAADMLDDPDRSLRLSAATLLTRIGTADLSDRVALALRSERDPRIVRALASALARTPTRGSGAQLMGAFRRAGDDQTRRTCAEALLAYHEQIASLEPEQLAELVGFADALDDSELSPPLIRLLSRGSGAQRDRVASLLGRDVPATLKAAAAAALVEDASRLGVLMDAASRDPALLSPALDAIARHGASDGQLRAVLGAPGITPGALLAACGRLANTIPLDQRYRLALGMRTPEHVIALLETGWDVPVGPDPYRVSSGLLLAESFHRAGRFVDTLDTVHALRRLGVVDRALLADLEARALLCLGRIEQAERFNASSLAWIEALESSEEAPYAEQIAELIRSRFGDNLGEEQASRFAELVKGIERSRSEAEGVQTPPPAQAP